MADVKDKPPTRIRRNLPRPSQISPAVLVALVVAVAAGLPLAAYGWHATVDRPPLRASLRAAMRARGAWSSAITPYTPPGLPPSRLDPSQGPDEVKSLVTTASLTASATAAAKPKAPTKAAAVVAAAGPLDAYRGLGSCVDIYDDRAWNDPAAAVRDMAKHSVRTLYLETSRFTGPALFKPAQLDTFVTAAHANRMRVVAWYLPYIGSSSADYSRIAQVIDFKTPGGQRFDSFALDIEQGVGDIGARNRALDTLSRKIRAKVGPSYPLGAIIPSPTGMANNGSWSPFPYTALTKYYDVFVPMSYYTYHGSGADAARSDTLSNVRIIRAQPGCSRIPVHLIGGISENSSAAEVQAFVRASVQTKCIGASLYGWPGTSGAMWNSLKAIKP
jgi:hypothetical protein